MACAIPLEGSSCTEGREGPGRAGGVRNWLCVLSVPEGSHHWEPKTWICYNQALEANTRIHGKMCNMFPEPCLSANGSRLLWAAPAGNTYLTDREKSPGALSLSRIRKAPSCRCLLSISSALALGILPKNHLRKEGKPVNICFPTKKWAVQLHK